MTNLRTNLECAIAVLAEHREARQWTDEAVAADLLTQLGVDPAAVAVITEAEVVAHEAAAKEAADRARAARDALNAQKAEEASPLPAGVPGTHEVETVNYSDGSSATGTPPLPLLSPEQQVEAQQSIAIPTHS